MQHPVSEQHRFTHTHLSLVLCARSFAKCPSNGNLVLHYMAHFAASNFSKSKGADLDVVGVFWGNTHFRCMRWMSSCAVCDPYMKGKWNNQKRRLATVLHPLLPFLWIQQEMPEAESALWLFFDSSNRWFPMEQVSLLICPTPTFFFLLTRKWFIP